MGAILLAILFAGVAAYRMIRPTPSAILPVTVPDQPAPAPAAAPDPAPAVAAPASTSLTAEVPPPPPPGTRAPKNRRSSGHPTEKVIIVDPALAVEEQPLPPPEPKAVETPKPEKLEPAPVDPPVVKEEPAAAPATQPVATADATPKTDSHGKKIGNAFRRLLHLPKKEAQPDTLKQP